MPHDHHGHSHSHDHHHHSHDDHTHGPGHNHDHAAPMHLHSHMDPEDRAAELAALTEQFIEGFKAASDKASYLRLSGVPLEWPSPSGGKPLKLVDLSIESAWQLAAASPGFGGGELNHMMFPGSMIDERINCRLTYVSLTEREDVDLRELLAARLSD
ncbi:MAG: hypothetical protein ACMVY4_02185 [Minwuia sp.]|uniref:hypothetical protein n=1 Tax=Minwuia sp. TaxID=2493630 RepID=UPI003A85B6CD